MPAMAVKGGVFFGLSDLARLAGTPRGSGGSISLGPVGLFFYLNQNYGGSIMTKSKEVPRTFMFYLKSPVKPKKYTQVKSDLSSLDVGSYLAHYGKSYKLGIFPSVTIYCLKQCLFEPNDGKHEAAICFSATPPFLTYQCFDVSCVGKTWKEIRAQISGSDSLDPFCGSYDPDLKLRTQMAKGFESKAKIIPEKLIILGRVLQALEGMQRRDVLWVLRKAQGVR